MASRYIDLGVRVHYLDEGAGEETFVLIHGLGGSHLNWASITPALAKRGRVLVPDLGGFGRTPPGPGGAHIDANVSLMARFVEAVAPLKRAVLIGNSMGGLISMRLAAEHPKLVRGLVLVDPAAPIPVGSRFNPKVAALFATYMIPGVAQTLMRRRAMKVGPEGLVRDMMKLCTVDVARIDPAVMHSHIELARERASQSWGIHAFMEAARSVTFALARRATYRHEASLVRAPTLLIHGARDRLIPVDAARSLAAHRPDWKYVEHHDLGHTPMLEAPGWFLGELEPWLDRLPSR